MTDSDDFFKEYNETDAVSFITEKLAEDTKNVTRKQLLYVIDLIWDYYEENGLLSIDLEEDNQDEVEISALANYIRKRNRKVGILSEYFPLEKIIEAELDYEKTLEDIF